MTIIAYRDGVMASDTQMSCDDIRTGQASKIRKVKGHLVGVCGIVNGLDALAEALVSGEPDDSFKDYSALLVKPNGKVFHYFSDAGKYGLEMKAPYHTTGSGQSVALGAFAVGATAEDAVRAAIKHCSSCGGKVKTITLD